MEPVTEELTPLQRLIQKWLGLHPAYGKWLVALLGFLSQVANLALLHGAAQHDLVIVLGLVTTLGVRLVSNDHSQAVDELLAIQAQASHMTGYDAALADVKALKRPRTRKPASSG